ncbi:MAG: Nicotinamide-nucleotide adenylyltransferase [Candidatus Saccharibacteria bacterium]|nr:Nicotinamide-nucleotide adenylyltransferase [Candidatus Saccharibacteria bacterium]
MTEQASNHETQSNTVGLVLGRFQPLHPGHLELIRSAMDECDEVVVCIGSAQLAEPFTIDERHDYLNRQLEVLHPDKKWRVVDLVDPEPMDIWPEYVKEKCGIEGEEHRFYRADKLSEVYEDRLKKLGFALAYITRSPFYFWFSDGLHRRVSSATEIKAIYEELGQPIPRSFVQAKESENK